MVGRRHRITRAEMAAIIRELGRAGWPIAENGYLDTTTDAAPERWASMVGGCCVVCCAPGLRDGCIRYDEPGSMHPLQRCQLMFVSSALVGAEYDQIGQMRRRCDRLMIVVD